MRSSAIDTSVQIVGRKPKVVNVASVSHLSPFRYPGGKTWFVPYIRKWLGSLTRRPRTFVEPFCGGAIVGLTVAAEGLADKVVLCELDEAVASVWRAVTEGHAEELAQRILNFEMSRDAAEALLAEEPSDLIDQAFQTIVRNRVQRGGIMAPGASLVRNGENGKGVSSRWYPDTLAKRLRYIHELRNRLEFVNGDGLTCFHRYASHRTAAVFVDPPYTAGGKKAGSRLYTHSVVDHQKLFAISSKAQSAVLLTYDNADEVRELATRYELQQELVPMKNTHHNVMKELVISNMGWCQDRAGENALAQRLKNHKFEPMSQQDLFSSVA